MKFFLFIMAFMSLNCSKIDALTRQSDLEENLNLGFEESKENKHHVTLNKSYEENIKDLGMRTDLSPDEMLSQFRSIRKSHKIKGRERDRVVDFIEDDSYTGCVSRRVLAYSYNFIEKIDFEFSVKFDTAPIFYFDEKGEPKGKKVATQLCKGPYENKI